ncbi:pyridoxine/pyridoxamine 5'-phosphate oxidase [Parapedobacter defluvii]|uniref:Pyridoxine/pyridoxamine 5'-phosphate oxidase n=1 Tax=Parapedobacter defluvii TaxID=2045106 RepID=A0ABQ1MRL1_9SPHI|nr:pyridoxamine 5'-phosphate oxidase [Parapedobacter defluvii]GGC45642.1 pyridoxine/pyridoxamine 5'-phosphate oxidase [Parapedobacter defluvii]
MLSKTDVAAIRTEYKMGQLSEGEVAADAIEQFQAWFDQAIEKQVMEPNAMTLSTVSASGRPSSRIVLLKQVNESGFGFYTNYQSQKGQELADNPYAALLFFWPELQRQVRVSGRTMKMPSELSDAYFQSRPKASQIGAIVSPQSQEIVDRNVLDVPLAAMEERYKDVSSLPRPAHWGGYWLVPESIEFWQGRSGRLHDRLRYSKQGNNWKITRLAP